MDEKKSRYRLVFKTKGPTVIPIRLHNAIKHQLEQVFDEVESLEIELIPEPSSEEGGALDSE